MSEKFDFIEYCLSFYGEGGLYDMGATREEILAACFLYLTARTDASLNFCGDSVDREGVRDCLTTMRKETA